MMHDIYYEFIKVLHDVLEGFNSKNTWIWCEFHIISCLVHATYDAIVLCVAY